MFIERGYKLVGELLELAQRLIPDGDETEYTARLRQLAEEDGSASAVWALATYASAVARDMERLRIDALKEQLEKAVTAAKQEDNKPEPVGAV